MLQDDSKEFFSNRDKAVARMRDVVDEIDPMDLPAGWAALIVAGVFCLILPLLLFKCVFLMLKRMVNGCLAILVAPLLSLVIFIDIALIMIWFCKAAARKLSGEEQ